MQSQLSPSKGCFHQWYQQFAGINNKYIQHVTREVTKPTAREKETLDMYMV